MATDNEDLYEKFIRRQVYVLRYASTLANEVFSEISKTDSAVKEVFYRYLSQLDGANPLIGRKNKATIREFEQALRGVRGDKWRELEKFVEKEAKAFIASDVDATIKALDGSASVVLGTSAPPSSQLIQVVNSQPFQGRTLKQWMSRTAQSDVEFLIGSAKNGIVQGQSVDQIVRNTVGPKKTAGQKVFRNTQATLRTIINGVQSEGRGALYEANKDIVKEERYVATLDSRTTIQCAANDGKVFKRGQGPKPPLHFNCRSLRIPYLNPNVLGNRPFNPSTERQILQEFTESNGLSRVRSRDQLPHGYKTRFDSYSSTRKRELIGQAPAETTYNDFLKNQSVQFQDEVLGATRAKMFRNGDIRIDQFTNRLNDVLTLDQLQQRGFDLPESA